MLAQNCADTLWFVRQRQVVVEGRSQPKERDVSLSEPSGEFLAEWVLKCGWFDEYALNRTAFVMSACHVTDTLDQITICPGSSFVRFE